MTVRHRYRMNDANKGLTLRWEWILTSCLLLILLFIIRFEMELIQTKCLVNNMIENGINYDSFREMRLSEDTLEKVKKKMKRILNKNPFLQRLPEMDEFSLLTFSMMANSFDLVNKPLVDDKTFCRGIGKVCATPSYQELYDYYKAILSNIVYFPVPEVAEATIYYDNSWYNLRTYGGNRRHEGTDLMASNNIRGYFPVISITDGVVEKKGWLEQGGYRIGIRSEAGCYFYYAHLFSYAPELEEGDKVIAGQLLGFMGDSGYGEEGTIGQFDVHLHMGIYINSKIGEISVNPYWIMRILERNRTSYEEHRTSD